ITPIRGQAFATHDMATADEDGYVRLLGRRDDMINRGGVKTYPLEIENALLMHPDVQEATTINIPDKIYGEKAISFVKVRKNSAVDSAALLQHCASLLPSSKAPADIVLLEVLPRNHRGKVLRSKLIQLYAAFRK